MTTFALTIFYELLPLLTFATGLGLWKSFFNTFIRYLTRQITGSEMVVAIMVTAVVISILNFIHPQADAMLLMSFGFELLFKSHQLNLAWHGISPQEEPQPVGNKKKGGK
jgi:hypothetical protein